MKTFTITFDEQQLQILNMALMELQFKHSAPLIAFINNEIKNQVNSTDNKKSEESKLSWDK